MGEVYLAWDPRLDRKVAIKRLPTGDDEQTRRRIRREARAAAGLKHQNIASIYDVVESDGLSIIVMEYVEGRSLADLIQEGPLPPDQVRSLGIQLADALRVAHEKGVIHRDLKPANIHLDLNGIPKILDFGLAYVTRSLVLESGESTLSASSLPSSSPQTIAGTPAYMPPEMLSGAVTDRRGDIYSLGVTLFEIATGQRPFKGQDFFSLSLAILNGPTPKALDLNPDVPLSLSQIIERAMARDPGDRFATATALRDALGPASARQDTWKRARIMAGVVVTIAVVFMMSRLDCARLPRSPANSVSAVLAVFPFASLSPDSTTQFATAAMTDILGTSLGNINVPVIPPDECKRLHEERMKLKQDASPALIARDLGAGYILDGGVQKSGDRLRVSVRLSRPGVPKLLWSRTLDGTLSDIFSLEQRVYDAVVDGLSSGGVLSPALAASAREQSTPPATASLEAEADYQQGRWFLENFDEVENIDRAIGLFRKALARDSLFALAHAGLGEALWSSYNVTHDSTSAIQGEQEVLRAAELLPGNVDIRLSLATMRIGRGLYERAESELQEIVRASPAKDNAWDLLAQTRRKLGRSDQAIEDYRRAITLRPSYWSYHNELGGILRDVGRRDEALAEYSRVIDLQPDRHTGYVNTGTVYHELADTAKALEFYRKSVEIKPNIQALNNIGSIAMLRGDFAGMVRTYQEALKLRPTDPRVWRNLGDAYQLSGQKALERDAYRHAITLSNDWLTTNPRDANIRGLMALCLAKIDQYDSAGVAIGRALEELPDDSRLLYRSATILALEGKIDPALARLELAIRKGFSKSEIREDPDMISLRSLPRFQVITDHNKGE